MTENNPCLCARNENTPNRCACGKELRTLTAPPGQWHKDRAAKLVMLHRCGNHNGSCNTWYFDNNN